MRSLKSVLISTSCFVVLWPAVLFSHSCFAQEAGLTPSESSTMDCPASDSDVISIAVQVADKAGRPIAGLEQANFKVFDNKQAEKILAFHAVDSAHPPAVPLKIQMILDAVDSDPVLIAQERDGLSAFLRQNSGKLEFSTSIWLFENTGLTQIAGPSQDGTALLAALSTARPGLRVIRRSGGTWGDSERTGQAISLLKEMIAPGSRTPGRKLIIFLSPGWPLLFNYEPDQRQSVFDDIVSLSNGLRESCISIDTLDPSSFDTLSHSRGADPAAYYDFLKGVPKSGDAQYGNLALQVLSEHSGGRVIMNGNDIQSEINTALRGAGAWYELVFERAPGSRATEYHAIRVTVDEPHGTIHTTAGYYVNGP